MDTATWVRILNEVVYISHVEEIIDLIILPSVMGK